MSVISLALIISLINFLSNASYSGYRNHIQKDTLQENANSGNVTDHDVDLLIGWSNKAAARAQHGT